MMKANIELKKLKRTSETNEKIGKKQKIQWINWTTDNNRQQGATMLWWLLAGLIRKGDVFDFSSLPKDVKAKISDHITGKNRIAFALTNKECFCMTNIMNLKDSHILELLCELIDNVPKECDGHFEMMYKENDSVFVIFHEGSIELQSSSIAPDEYFQDICKELKFKHKVKDATELNFESLHIFYSNQEERFAVYSILFSEHLKMGDKWMELSIGSTHDVSPLQTSRFSKLRKLT